MDHEPPPPSPLAPCAWGFSRQEYWSGLPCLPPEFLLHPGIKPASLLLPWVQWSPELGSGLFTTSTTWEALFLAYWDAV